jgi:hypothetical protein
VELTASPEVGLTPIDQDRSKGGLAGAVRTDDGYYKTRRVQDALD